MKLSQIITDRRTDESERFQSCYSQLKRKKRNKKNLELWTFLRFCLCQENDKYLTVNLVFCIYGCFVTWLIFLHTPQTLLAVFSNNFTAFKIISNYSKKCFKKLRDEEGQHLVNWCNLNIFPSLTWIKQYLHNLSSVEVEYNFILEETWN